MTNGLMRDIREAVAALLIVTTIFLAAAVAIPIAGEVAISRACNNAKMSTSECDCFITRVAELPDKSLSYRIYAAHLGVPAKLLGSDFDPASFEFSNFESDPLLATLVGIPLICAFGTLS